jgi:hypothetical protein
MLSFVNEGCQKSRSSMPAHRGKTYTSFPIQVGVFVGFFLFLYIASAVDNHAMLGTTPHEELLRTREYIYIGHGCNESGSTRGKRLKTWQTRFPQVLANR